MVLAFDMLAREIVMQAANITLPDYLPTSPPPPSEAVSNQLPTVKIEAPTLQVEHPSMFDVSPSPSSILAILIEIASPIPIEQAPSISISDIGISFGIPQLQGSILQSPIKRSGFASPPTPTPSPPKNLPSAPPPSYPKKTLESSTPTLSQSPNGAEPAHSLAHHVFSSSTALANPSNESSTTISLVDDSVPSLPHKPPVNARSTAAKSPSLSQSVALNLSSSGFMLLLPLLGRTKNQDSDTIVSWNG